MLLLYIRKGNGYIGPLCVHWYGGVNYNGYRSIIMRYTDIGVNMMRYTYIGVIIMGIDT